MTSINRSLALTMLAFVAACAGASTAASTGGTASATSAEISEADLRDRLFRIAHDSMMGRESGSEGAFKATEYIAAEFKRLGLEPAGENGTYFQTVPLWRVAVDTASRLRVGDVTLAPGGDFLPTALRAVPRVFEDTPVVFGGALGDSARWIAAEQATGKVVVLDVPDGTPIFGLGPVIQRWTGARCRADHYSYARYGIPSLAISRGEHLDYHQVTDEPQYISYRDLARVSRMVHDATISIANADARPALDAPRPTHPNAPCRQ